MTPARLSACLYTIHWTPAALSRAARVSERTVHRWLSGAYPVPERLASWLETLSAFHEAHPPP
jgi:lambda repressor-like predicted transcriptional regulator